MSAAIGAALLGALGSSLPTAALLRVSPAARRRWIPSLVAFAAGTLLAAATIELLPEAFAGTAPPNAVATTMLAALLGFVVVDLGLGHRHGHDAQTRLPPQAGVVVLLGDGLHNFADGVALAAAFAASPRAGVATALAILAHELPQQLGNLALLLEAGWRPTTAFLWSVAVNLAIVAGAGAAGAAMGWAEAIGPYLLAVACAGFLYVAAADLLPSLQHGPRHARALRGGLVVFGAVTVWALHAALG